MQFINILFTLIHCTCLHILQTMRLEQISFLASSSDHWGEELGSGWEQNTLCVRCPQVAKGFSCSSSGNQELAMFHISLLERRRTQKEMLFVTMSVSSPASIINNRRLTPALLHKVSVCVCVWPVSHWSSSDPRALMWNSFNPSAQCFGLGDDLPLQHSSF